MAAIFLNRRRSSVCVAVIAVVGFLLSGCTSLLFFPQRDLIATPQDGGLEYEDVSIPSADGGNVHGWLLKAKHPRATVVHLHGNAENISTHIGSVYWLPNRGFDVLMIDYRGFGKSSGSPSASSAREDIAGAIKFAADRNDLPIIVLGQSIGGSLAVPVVTKSPYRDRIAALVLDSSFSSFRAIVREKLSESWLFIPFAYPASWFFSDAESPEDTIAQVAPIPVLIVHASVDPIVARAHADRLFTAAQEPKKIIIADHNGHIASLSDEVYRNEIVEYFDSVLRLKNSAMQRASKYHDSRSRAKPPRGSK